MKILKSKKALSPVVASIILIAVTVAVSIAVAAWMGAIPGRFITQPQLSITDMKFDGTDNKTITIKVSNTGTAVGTVAQIKVNGVVVEKFDPSPASIPTAAKNETIIVTLKDPWTAGYKYIVVLYSQSGDLLATREEYAPS
jgi:flagellin-like protein